MLRNEPLILIADDDPIVRALMRATLEGEGICRGRGGRRRGRVPHLRGMPAGPGDRRRGDAADGRFGLCRESRRRPASAHVPILMATELDDVASITAAYEAGATDFISKPINWFILSHRVRYMLRAGHAFEEAQRTNELLELRVEERAAELRAMQAKLLQQERLSTLGQLTATVAHELRIPWAPSRTCWSR